MNIAISSGKGGTGKTFVSTNIARVLEKMGKQVTYLDCDVEEPNGHLFLKPDTLKEETINLLSPVGVDAEKCNICVKCVEACKYNAMAKVKDRILIFKNLCHICGACALVCPKDAIVEEDRKIGVVRRGKSGNIDIHYGLLETGEGGMTPRLIKSVKKNIGEGVNIVDSPPGTSCPVVETVRDSDLTILVTDPTPFGVNDLKLAVDMCRELGIEPVVLVNRAEYPDSELRDYCSKESLDIIAEIPADRLIAEVYSRGDLIVDENDRYNDVFLEIAKKILHQSKKDNTTGKKARSAEIETDKADALDKAECSVKEKMEVDPNQKEVVVISGKGGTGKTSIVASFCALEKSIAISDCDVDAADLHLILKPRIVESGLFSGGKVAQIDNVKCISCGRCRETCRFGAVIKNYEEGCAVYMVDKKSCEGCAACAIVCPTGSIKFKTAINGEWFLSDTRFGPMSHAKLGAAEENSGKLVTLIRNKKNQLAAKNNINLSIIDGSPGTGCPVIASITGTDYAVIVTEPTVSGVHDLKRVLDVIKFFGIKSGVVVNKFDLNIDKANDIIAIAKEYGADFLGKIGYDKSVTKAQIKGLSVIEFTDSEITDEIKDIWQKIKENVNVW